MPTYVYKCAENGHVFDVIQKFSDEPGADCPTCGSESRRQITAPTVIYKGSGFYTTDYGSGASSVSGAKNGKTSSDSKSESDSSSSSKSDDSSAKSSTSDKKSSESSSSSHSHSHGGSSHSHGAGSHTH